MEKETSQTICREADLPTFKPLPSSVTMRKIQSFIPSHLFVRSTPRAISYLVRDCVIVAAFWTIAVCSDALGTASPIITGCARWGFWLTYWWFQGLAFTGIWVIGHEAGHGAFSDHKLINDVVGFISHHRHHSNHASVERDEVYVPKTRADLGVPELKEGHYDHSHDDGIDYDEFFGDSPIYALYILIRRQLFAFPAYLLFNVSGQRNYPKFTNHFDPNSILFTKSQRNVVILSNFGIASMVYLISGAIRIWGWSSIWKYYGVPWLCVTHWFAMITYLHHTDPTVPHYRNKEWNFQRGAAATVDRNFLGWQGRFFLHDVAHFHVVHHHGEEATKYLKEIIGDNYHQSNAPVFSTLWNNYHACRFVENGGDVLFYRNGKGRAARRPAQT
ncbi:hypothetical protein BDZ94DRAFT_1285801 [Collybia nuda]|uniref:Fatty acid desaturase domain-containing protein n=1 Tax=Collybia nuda TaxID=64659 RepID=A0A9P5XT23_9AGAR|nr:hypothetical protein BDZ94DRAFT_1285801 [Collybia nuda]